MDVARIRSLPQLLQSILNCVMIVLVTIIDCKGNRYSSHRVWPCSTISGVWRKPSHQRWFPRQSGAAPGLLAERSRGCHYCSLIAPASLILVVTLIIINAQPHNPDHQDRTIPNKYYILQPRSARSKVEQIIIIFCFDYCWHSSLPPPDYQVVSADNIYSNSVHFLSLLTT